jgi:hypothetical protein
MRDTGQPGEPSPAQLKGGRSEATRGDSPPESPEDATAGQPEGARLAHPEDAGTGATRGLIARLDGTIDDPMSYAASMQESGQPEDAKTTQPEKLKIRGNPEIHSPVPLKDA